MRGEAMRDWGRGAVHAGLVAWALSLALIAIFVIDPHPSHASPFLSHGALQRHGEVGIVSHRGAAAVAPENTLASARTAIEQGVDFVEVDVQTTADGVPVLMHDETVERTTDGTGKVARLTLAEVQTLDAGSSYSDEFVGEPVPTLEEFVDLILPAPAGALIEFKGHWTVEEVRSAVDLLRDHHLMHRVILQSFEVPVLEELHAYAPEYARMLLTRSLDTRTLDVAIATEVSAIGARAQLYDDAPDTVAIFRELGMGVLVYTLNTEATWAEAVDRGNDLIITDDPIGLADWRVEQGLDRAERRAPARS